MRRRRRIKIKKIRRPSIRITRIRRVPRQKQGRHKNPKKRVLALLGVIGFAAGLFLLSWLLRMQGVKGLDRSTLIPVMETKTFNMGYMNASGKIAIGATYIYAGEFQGDVAVVRTDKDGQQMEGLIDRNGKTVFPFIGADLQLCEDGTVVASKDTSANENGPMYGYFSSDGKQILPFDYQYISLFSDGKAFAQKDGAWLVIDRTGKAMRQLTGVKLVLTGLMGDGLVPFTTKGTDYQSSYEGEQWGYLNADGTVAIPERYLFASNYESGRALVVRLSAEGQRETVLIDKAGREVKNLGTYEFGYGFTDGIAIGVGAKGFGALNENGDWVVEPKYAQATYSDGVITVEASADRFLFFNKRGAMLLEWKYPCTAFTHGFIFYTKGGKTYMMDIYGNAVCEVPAGVKLME